jgi:hypothetical protein
MPAATGFCLKVLAPGQHQLGTKCEKLSGELAADAKPPSMPTSGWLADRKRRSGR